MKLLITIFAFFLSISLTAQSMMMNFNKVHLGDQTEAYEMFEEFFIPQYDALVDEGKLINFGMLGHGWGDEWNLNYFMTAKNQDELIKAFGKGFSEAIKTMGPEKWKKMKGMIMEHKDNLYDVRHYHDKK